MVWNECFLYYAADIFRQQVMIFFNDGQIAIIGSVMVIPLSLYFSCGKMGRKPLMLLGTGGLALIYIIEGYFFHINKLGIPIVV